jgi:hypothetical protein
MRIQAFEFMDLPQTPRFLRDSVVESLGNSLRWSSVYKNAAAVFAKFCESLQSNTILDLCSGSGEPVAILLDALNKQGERLPCFLISDLFPVIHEMEKVIEQFPENIQAINTPLDASNVPDSYPHSARVVISAFHHFAPGLAESILRDSAERGKPIFILEAMTRHFNSVLKLGFFFLLGLMINPFLSKQDRLLKTIFTYLIPLIPLMGLWDGVVSIMRVYTGEELIALTATIDAKFQWEFQKIRVGWNSTISVFIGMPHEATIGCESANK